MRVATFNLNGIRAAWRKGFLDWVRHWQPDIICLQETRAQVRQMLDVFELTGYELYASDAQKKGYSGVAIYTKEKPNTIHHQLGWDLSDNEGRFISLTFRDIDIISVYFPSGSAKEERQLIKYQFLDIFYEHMQTLISHNRPVIIAGDWNIAHHEIDLKNWKANQKHSGFLPEERQWLTKVINTLGFVDSFRHINQAPEQYTWWSNRGRAWEKNVGWRIDYQMITPCLASKIQSVHIDRSVRISDHAPFIVDYDWLLTST